MDFKDRRRFHSAVFRGILTGSLASSDTFLFLFSKARESKGAVDAKTGSRYRLLSATLGDRAKAPVRARPLVQSAGVFTWSQMLTMELGGAM